MLLQYPVFPITIHDLVPSVIIKKWISKGTKNQVKKGDLLLTAGQPSEWVYYLETGKATLYYNHFDGKECIFSLLSSHDFINFPDIFSDQESFLYCKALTDLNVIRISKDQILQDIAQDPSLGLSLLKFFANRHQDLLEVLTQVAYGKVEERLIFCLRKLIDSSDRDGEWYPLPQDLTHKDIAGMIASTRETVTVLLNKLIKAKILRLHNHCLWIRISE